jgi:hypothetical protein
MTCATTTTGDAPGLELLRELKSRLGREESDSFTRAARQRAGGRPRGQVAIGELHEGSLPTGRIFNRHRREFFGRYKRGTSTGGLPRQAVASPTEISAATMSCT